MRDLWHRIRILSREFCFDSIFAQVYFDVRNTMSDSVLYEYYVATDQGRREYMEDFVCTNRQHLTNKNKWTKNFHVKNSDDLIEYFAVFDGHGGNDAAHFAQNNLLDEITKQTGFWSEDKGSVSRAISNGFISTTKAMWNVLGECKIGSAKKVKSTK